MLHRHWLLAAIAPLLMLDAGEVVRKAEDYPARMKAGAVVIAAESLGPSVPTPSGGLFTSGYIAIEIAFFSEGAGRLAPIAHGHFSLRINGSKTLLGPDSPGAVAASIKYPDWEQPRTLEATAGMGDANVILERPRAVERFPGDQRPAQQGGSGPMPRVENPVARKAGPISVDELVRLAALPEGDVPLPVSGCVFFPYKKKMKTIKSLELVYEGPLGAGSLRLL